MSRHLALLLVCAVMLLAGLAITAFLVVHGQGRKERLQQRFQAATTPHQRMRRIEAVRSIRARTADEDESLLVRAAGWFGFNPNRAEQYPMKWYFVVLLMLVASRLIAGVAVGFFGAPGWLPMPGIWVLGCRATFGMMAARRQRALYNQFPDCLAMIVRSVRAGVPVTEAMRIVARESPAPSSVEFSRVAADLAIGTPITDALRTMADRNDITEFRFFATALSLQSQTGGRLGETLDNLADIVRKRVALRSRGRALSAEARTSALVLGGLPVAVGVLLYVISPDYISVLFNDPTGHLILGAAAAMLGIGAFIMRTIIEKALA